MKSFAHWLAEIGLESYASVFAQNEVDFDVLASLTEADLQALGLPLGARKRLLQAIAKLDRQGAAEPISPPTAAPVIAPLAPSPAPDSPAGERRQLTVMFCDLVGSTALSQKLDPEELRALLHDYRTVCGEVITRYEGFVARYVGDGILTYFGWPKAHEEDAERALRAALEIVQAVKDAASAESLSVRIGIATGPVVVGEQAGEGDQSKLAIGSTPNLAARLQGLAAADQIVIASSTRRLVSNAFELADLGERELKGIAEPVHAWRVVDVSPAESRFEASHGAQVTPLVGREQEIGLLLDRWQRTHEGEGQVVLLTGEPGIGKSRILNTLRERLEDQGVGTLRFQCSPYYINSALYPSIDNFERALKFGRDEPAESKLDKLEALIVAYGRPLADVRFIASLLSLPCEARYGALPLTQQKHKDETLRTLVDLTEAAARKQPTVMLFEDLHWADPTSLEALDLLIDRVRATPLLIVLTHRPEFQSRWSGHGHVAALNLSKLTRAQSGAMVSKLAGGKTLPAELLEQILAKTDGVPLYVEELTKSILESGELRDVGDHYDFAGVARSITIPATLRDSLAARLDRSPAAKEIAQIGAAIGREFSYELIAAVAPHTQTELDSALNQLTESGLAFRRGTPPEATYTFKHALVQDAAYDSLLKTRRQALHAKIARVLEEHFPATKDTEPELLAHHYSRSGNADKAAEYLDLANQKAVKAYAMTEAKAYFDEAMALLDVMPANVSNRRRRISMLVNQWLVFWLLYRYPEYYEFLTGHEQTAVRLDDEALLGAFYTRLGHCHWVFGHLEQTLVTATKAAQHCESAGNLEDVSFAYLQLQWTHMHLSNYEQSLQWQVRTLDALTRRFDLRWYSWSLAGASYAYQYLGRWDDAIEEARKELAIAEKYSDASLIGFAHWILAQAYTAKGDLVSAVAHAETAVSIAPTTGDKAWAQSILGWAWCRAGQAAKASQMLAELIPMYQATRFIPGEVYTSAFLGEAYWRAGESDKARGILEHVLDLTSQAGMRFFQGSVHRLLGELGLASGVSQGDVSVAASHFQKAIPILKQINAENELAQAYAGYARCHKQSGDFVKARHYLNEALEIFERLGTWNQPDEVKQLLVGLPET